MKTPTNLKGHKFGLLTALELMEKRSYGSAVWKLRCDCGNMVERSFTCLRNACDDGYIPSCGCGWKVTAKPGRPKKKPAAAADLAGQKFGMLTAVRYEDCPTDTSGARWRFKCDCGGETIARAKDVKLGTTRSCGCARFDHRKHRGGRDAPGINPGDRFGKLTVTWFAGAENGSRYYQCDCDCGAATKVRAALLGNGQTRSCGCMANRPAKGSRLRA